MVYPKWRVSVATVAKAIFSRVGQMPSDGVDFIHV